MIVDSLHVIFNRLYEHFDRFVKQKSLTKSEKNERVKDNRDRQHQVSFNNELKRKTFQLFQSSVHLTIDLSIKPFIDLYVGAFSAKSGTELFG